MNIEAHKHYHTHTRTHTMAVNNTSCAKMLSKGVQEDRGGPYSGGSGAEGTDSDFPKGTTLGDWGTAWGVLLECSLPSASNITAKMTHNSM